ncbi:hypothetical protein [Nocardioides sp.]|uniref:hypothetical protein n=1 Tax=Nocardioides sp. TaxID=35761 RepID=UPI0035137D98
MNDRSTSTSGRFSRPVVCFVAGAACATLMTGTAMAAGATFLLGKANTAPTTSTLTSKKGPALALKATGPVLSVGNSDVIAKLNADLLDGRSVSDFATREDFAISSYSGDGYTYDADNNGVADEIGAFVSCPPGSSLVDGGFEDKTGSHLTYAGPGLGFDNDGWLILSAADPTPANADKLKAFVLCQGTPIFEPRTMSSAKQTRAAIAHQRGDDD